MGWFLLKSIWLQGLIQAFFFGDEPFELCHALEIVLCLLLIHTNTAVQVKLKRCYVSISKGCFTIRSPGPSLMMVLPKNLLKIPAGRVGYSCQKMVSRLHARMEEELQSYIVPVYQ